MALLAATGDFQTGVLGGNITAIADAFTITTGLTIPATNGVLQIDNDSTAALGAASGPETISYATYSAVTGAITGATRGLAGTTGVTHSAGATVSSGHSTAYAGQGTILNTDLCTTAGEPGGTWKAWTPTFTNLTVGAGALAAYYTKIGKTVHYRLSWTFGVGSAVGSTPTFTLPVTSVNYGTATYFRIGEATLYDSGVAYFLGLAFWTNTTTATIYSHGVSGTTTLASGITADLPMTWATGDQIIITGTYEAA